LGVFSVSEGNEWSICEIIFFISEDHSLNGFSEIEGYLLSRYFLGVFLNLFDEVVVFIVVGWFKFRVNVRQSES
jgi:hypothetical protein